MIVRNRSSRRRLCLLGAFYKQTPFSLLLLYTLHSTLTSPTSLARPAFGSLIIPSSAAFTGVRHTAQLASAIDLHLAG